MNNVCNNNIKCNMCEWEGDENDLFLIETEGASERITAYEDPHGAVIRLSVQPDIVSFFKGCPNCKTDDYLMDK